MTNIRCTSMYSPWVRIYVCWRFVHCWKPFLHYRFRNPFYSICHSLFYGIQVWANWVERIEEGAKSRKCRIMWIGCLRNNTYSVFCQKDLYEKSGVGRFRVTMQWLRAHTVHFPGLFHKTASLNRFKTLIWSIWWALWHLRTYSVNKSVHAEWSSTSRSHWAVHVKLLSIEARSSLKLWN